MIAAHVLRAVLLAAAGCLAAPGCGLTVTAEPRDYEDLRQDERSVVDTANARIADFDRVVRALGGPPLDRILGRTNVDFQDLMLVANWGTGRVHVAVWDNLGDDQRAIFAGWFDDTDAMARFRYETLAYEYLVAHAAALQVVYELYGVEYAVRERAMFNNERDAERLTVDYWQAIGRPGMVEQASASCAHVRRRFDARYEAHFDKYWYRDHLPELADPDDPSGYFWFLCKHHDNARARQTTLAEELAMMKERATRTDEP